MGSTDTRSLVLALDTYQYTSLQPQDGSFRLLKLLRNNGPEIECELSSQSLFDDERDPYEALSYVWGSSELVECIKLNGKRLWITDNLYAALQNLRLSDRDRHLWIDAICINQANKQEQGRQVQQMGEIFRHAEKVLFWLGKATSEIMTLMDALNQLQSVEADRDSGQFSLADSLLEDCRTGLRQLLDRQWFTRVWILQEVANAQNADVCSGTRSVPAETFVRALSLFEEEPAPHCQTILDIMPGSSRSQSWWAQERDLYTLLHKFQASKATNERDKIYALLGLSSNSLDMQSVDIDYQQSTPEAIHKVVAYLLSTTLVSVREIFELMTSFETINTSYFVLPTTERIASGINFSRSVQWSRSDPKQPRDSLEDIAFVNNPTLFLFEERPERNSKSQETCYDQAVKVMLNVNSSQAPEKRRHNYALEVLAWGSVEQHVKIIVIHDKTESLFQAAKLGHNQIFKELYRLQERVQVDESWKGAVLQQAVKDGYDSAVEILLHQDTYVNTEDERFDIAFREASSRGYKQIVQLLLDSSIDKKTQVERIRIALPAAALGGHEQIVKLLLDAGADPNAVDEFGRSHDYGLLQMSVSRGNEQIVKLLLDAGADVNAQGPPGRAIQEASARGRESIVKLLLDAGADVNAPGPFGSAIHEASARGRESIVKLLLEAGADVDAQGPSGSAIQEASSRGYETIVKLLIDAGADVNAHSPSGSAIQEASLKGHETVVKLLLDAGANVKAQHKRAVWNASLNGHEQVVKLLLNADADVNAQAYSRAIQVASLRGYEKIVDLLIKAGVDVNVEPSHISSPIDAAASGGHELVVKLLLNAGADVNIGSGYYGSTLQAAASEGHDFIVQLLLDAGADVNAQGGPYSTAIQAASFEGHETVVKLLLKAGADVNIQSGPYGTALQAALSNDHEAVVKLLIDAGAKDDTEPGRIEMGPLAFPETF